MSPMKRDPEAVAQAVMEADSIAVCSHINPDGDTIGSALAIRLGLISLGKKVSVFCQDKVPDNLMFLPGADMIGDPGKSTGSFDLMLAVDVSDIRRLGTGSLLIARSKRTAQIDHHPTNPQYMQINSVDGETPATCMLIYEQLKVLGVPLTTEIGMCLYTGISTDTGNYAFASTNAEAFEITAELMRTGIPLSMMNRILFRERSREQVLLMGRALSSLRYEAGGKLAVMTLTRKDFDDCGAKNEHADTLVNFGLETVGTKMAILAREDEEENVIKISLRAKEPARVDDIAQRFGGGGHPQAAGISMRGTLDAVTAVVAAAMAEKLIG